jgi:LacI family transcriptional regulator
MAGPGSASKGDPSIVTIKDVADVAGVSIATVSRVINGNYPVSKELQTRVQDAMGALDYRPNAVARGLRRQRTQTIGVLIPRLNDPFFSTFCDTIERMLFANQYRSLLCSTDEALQKETAYVDSLLQQRVDGVIMFPREHSRKNVERLLNENVPVVLVERELPDLPVHQVSVTNYDGGYAGMRHLIELGHREIGLFTAYTNRFPMRDRLQGAMDALHDAGISQRPEHFQAINTDDPRIEIGYRCATAILKQSSRPTAIFALTDEIAIGALHAMIGHGVKVPDDLSLIGFDNIPMASFVVPALTSVAQPIVQMGETAGEILMRALEDGSEEVQRITLETTLVVRNSTGPAVQARR